MQLKFSMNFTSNDKMVLGIALQDKSLQISYSSLDKKNVETFSIVTGEEDYNIPMLICKKPGKNQWLCGQEALLCAQEENGIVVTDLLERVRENEPVQIEGELYYPEILFTLFLKKCLGMLAKPLRKIAGIAVTGKNLPKDANRFWQQVFQRLHMENTRLVVLDEEESFYYYILNQNTTNWTDNPAVLYHYAGNSMYVYHANRNREAEPVVLYIDKKEYPFRPYQPVPEEKSLCSEKLACLDEEFLELVQSVNGMAKQNVIYLVGDDFSQEWLNRSLEYLCRDRRVFMGTNLFSKGACYGILELLRQGEASKNFVFLGSQRLCYNIGMNILRQGEAAYVALLDAGTNLHYADRELEFYVQEGNRIELIFTSLSDSTRKVANITLEELPQGISRLKLHLYVEEEHTLKIELEDLGFGEFRKATHNIWQEEMPI